MAFAVSFFFLLFLWHYSKQKSGKGRNWPHFMLLWGFLSSPKKWLRPCKKKTPQFFSSLHNIFLAFPTRNSSKSKEISSPALLNSVVTHLSSREKIGSNRFFHTTTSLLTPWEVFQDTHFLVLCRSLHSGHREQRPERQKLLVLILWYVQCEMFCSAFSPDWYLRLSLVFFCFSLLLQFA